MTRFVERQLEDLTERAHQASAHAQAACQLLVEGEEFGVIEALVGLILPLQEALVLARLALTETLKDER